MTVDFEKIAAETTEITTPLNDILNWRWEAERQAMLSEFASGKAAKTLTVLRDVFVDEWDKKTIKKAPTELKKQLGDLVKLTKEQKLFTRPATEQQPALLAIWWPWGHGSTYSLRLTILPASYTNTKKERSAGSFIQKLRNLFS